MAAHATVAAEQIASLIQLWSSCQRHMVTLAAGCLDVAGRQERFLARQGAVMSFGGCGGCALAAMTDDTSELVEAMGNDWMPAERLGAYVHEACLAKAGMAALAPIDDT
jgi:hypothetical protein